MRLGMMENLLKRRMGDGYGGNGNGGELLRGRQPEVERIGGGQCGTRGGDDGVDCVRIQVGEIEGGQWERHVAVGGEGRDGVAWGGGCNRLCTLVLL